MFVILIANNHLKLRKRYIMRKIEKNIKDGETTLIFPPPREPSLVHCVLSSGVCSECCLCVVER